MSTSRRINPDSIQTLWFTVGVVGFLAATSFMVSFAGLTEVAKWVGVPTWMRWTVPAFIDMAILAYSLAVLIHRSRGEATWASWISLGLFTGVSVIANAAHALSIEHAVNWQAWIGAGIAALAPIGVFAATEELGRLAVEQPASAPKKEPVESLGEHPVSQRPAPAARSEALPTSPPSSAPALVLPPVVEMKPEPDEDPEPPTTPEPEPTKTEDSPEVEAEAATPLFDQVVEEAVAVPVREPETVALTPTLTVVSAPPRGAEVADLDKLTRWVALEVEAGRTPSAKAAAELLGASERTARRKLASLKDNRPELFSTSERKQA